MVDRFDRTLEYLEKITSNDTAYEQAADSSQKNLIQEARLFKGNQREVELNYLALPEEGIVLDHNSTLLSDSNIRPVMMMFKVKIGELFEGLIREGLNVSLIEDPDEEDIQGVIHNANRLLKGGKSKRVNIKKGSENELTEGTVLNIQRNVNPHFLREKDGSTDDDQNPMDVVLSRVRAVLFDEMLKPTKKVVYQPEQDEDEKRTFPDAVQARNYILGALSPHTNIHDFVAHQLKIEVKNTQSSLLDWIRRGSNYAYFSLRTRQSPDQIIRDMTRIATNLVLGHNLNKFKGKSQDEIRKLTEERLGSKNTRSRRPMLAGIYDIMVHEYTNEEA